MIVSFTQLLIQRDITETGVVNTVLIYGLCCVLIKQGAADWSDTGTGPQLPGGEG